EEHTSKRQREEERELHSPSAVLPLVPGNMRAERRQRCPGNIVGNAVRGMPSTNVRDCCEEHVEPEEAPVGAHVFREARRLERRSVLVAHRSGEVVMAALDEPPEGG